MTEPILWLSLRPADQSPLSREELWGHLLSWCLARSLFIGGSLEGVVLYAPAAPVTRLQYRQLKAWLQGRKDVLGFEIKLREVSALHGQIAQAAYIEAVSQAQEFLAERMAQCALSLAGVSAPLDQRWSPSLSADGASLTLRLSRAQLQIGISRLDRAPAPELDRLSNRRLRLMDLESLIPTVIALHWRQLEGVSDLSVGEWVAEHHGWRINLCADPGSGLSHREVFLRWMEWICAG